MYTYIALLRGINVGGHKKVPMADLRSLLEKKGLQNVQTYIQSGNVVFQSSKEDTSEIEGLIKQAVLDHFSFEVPIFVRTREQLQFIFNDCPFSQEKKENSYFNLLDRAPKKELVEKVSSIDYADEEFMISQDCIYFYCSKGYGRVKFNANFFERNLKVTMTSRNYNTMVKLIEMSS